jgi:hypothetical protein
MTVRSPEDRVQLHAHVGINVRRDLAEIARTNDRSLAAEIRRALAEHVRRQHERKQS